VTEKLFIMAGLFEGPWMIMILVLASGLINWLAKRRQEQAGEDSREKETPPQPALDWEERLRRMLGEPMLPPNRPAQPTPPTQPAPPLRRPTPTTQRPPLLRPASQPSAVRRPTIEVVAPIVTRDEVSGHGVEDAVRHFEQLDPAVMTPVRPLGAVGKTRGSALGTTLRRPQVARQAFLASLVFGPPKGLEE
jgi:hypothetical protein